MASKPRERVHKQAPSSPMNWRPRTAEDLIGQAKRVAMAQASKAKRLASDPSATMKLLLYGPPGCGKTMLARATAGEVKAGFLSVGISDVLDMYIGQNMEMSECLDQRIFFCNFVIFSIGKLDLNKSSSHGIISA